MKRDSGADTHGAARGEPVRAAEYVRMSTEHQKYSTENQADAIRQYAERRGCIVVRTYADEGKSGLSLDGRDALKRLIDDVQSGNADFTTILVYDVSRWGRFQDADESAYYGTSASARASTSSTAPSSSRMMAARSRPSSRASSEPWPASTAASSRPRSLLAVSVPVIASSANAEWQPRMYSARQNLLQARRDLQQASRDKGGHRARALRLIDRALAEVSRGIRYDNRHDTWREQWR